MATATSPDLLHTYAGKVPVLSPTLEQYHNFPILFCQTQALDHHNTRAVFVNYPRINIRNFILLCSLSHPQSASDMKCSYEKMVSMRLLAFFARTLLLLLLTHLKHTAPQHLTWFARWKTYGSHPRLWTTADTSLTLTQKSLMIALKPDFFFVQWFGQT